MKQVSCLMMNLIKSAISKTEVDCSAISNLSLEQLNLLFSIAKTHDVAQIVGYAIDKSGVKIDEQVKQKFQKEQILAVLRYEQQKYELEQISKIFEKEGVDFIPLKGSVIREFYPEKWLRTSCDIDILIREENLERAIDALTINGYKVGGKEFHDVSLFSPSNIHLELHFNIQENIKKLDAVLKDAWKYAVNINCNHYKFTKEFFIFHIFSHMSYHFLSGGCGVRSLIDIWIIKQKMGICYLDAEKLLSKANILKFAKEMDNLIEICFADKCSNEFYDSLLNYILNGGVYGSLTNDIAINDSKTHVTFKYIVRRIFIPVSDMAIEYPKVKKFPVLYVFVWFCRTFKLFFAFMKRVFTRRRAKKNVSDKSVDKMLKMRGRLGL